MIGTEFRENTDVSEIAMQNKVEISEDAQRKFDALWGDDKFDEVQPDLEGEYYSSYEERICHTPRTDGERGEWSGRRGESDFTPNKDEIKDILSSYEKDCISYSNAIPDFSEVSESSVEISCMTENRADNFRQCDEKCAEQWNAQMRDGRSDWTPRDVKSWRQENGYSWHERNDMKMCDLVPTDINDYFGHLGGVSECKKRDLINQQGDDFDE